MTDIDPWPWPMRMRPHPTENAYYALVVDGTPIRVPALGESDDDRAEYVLARAADGCRCYAAMVLNDLVAADAGVRCWAEWVTATATATAEDDDLLRRWLARGVQVRTQRAPTAEDDMAALERDDIDAIVAVLDRWPSVAVHQAVELHEDHPVLQAALCDQRIADLGSIVHHLAHSSQSETDARE